MVRLPRRRSSGRQMATSTTKSSQHTESTASGEARNICHLGDARNRALRPVATLATGGHRGHARLSRQPDTRIDDDVDQVHDQVEQDDA